MADAAVAQLLLVLTMAGCGQQPRVPEGRTPPNPTAASRYGALRPEAAFPGRLEGVAPTVTAPLPTATARFYVLESELSPAVLVHSEARYLGVFTALGRQGLGAPSHVGWSTAGGPRAFKSGEAMDVTRMEENWVLAWFAGTAGWTHWDVPWAVFLQHRPASMKLDAEGLHFTFSNRVGDVVLLPLYGVEKAPLKGMDFRAQHGLPAQKVPVKTWEWAAALPRDPLIRVRYWAGATRRIPVSCEETFGVNRADDSISFRWRFGWHSIEDEWKTKPLRVAPLSPTLALAVRDPAFPATFDRRPFDLGMFTPFGPMHGVPDVDAIEATFPLLQYVHETEIASGGETGHRSAGPRTNSNPATLAAARERLSALARELQSISPPSALDDSSWRAMGWAARATSHLDAGERTNVLSAVRARLSAHVAAATGSGLQATPGFLEALWAYAHFGDDWDFVRRNWRVVKAAADFGANSSWAGFGPDRVVSNGDLGGASIALARLAYQAGDLEGYQQACARVTRELVHLWVRQRGAATFQEHQPLDSMEPMQGPVFLTELDPARPGWRLDGPKYPAAAGLRQSDARWDRFDSVDVGRFLQDYLRAEVRRDLDAWERATTNDTRGFLGRLQLRSLLLDEMGVPSEVPVVARPMRSWPAVGQDFSEALCLLRLGETARFERLIPPAAASARQLAPESALPPARLSRGLAVEVRVGAPASAGSTPAWPDLGWAHWRTPSGAAWTFGQLKGARHGGPLRVEAVALNRHTRMLVCELP